MAPPVRKKFKRFTISLPGELLIKVQTEFAGINKSELIADLLQAELERRQNGNYTDLKTWFLEFHKSAKLKSTDKKPVAEQIRQMRDKRIKSLIANAVCKHEDN